MVDIFKEIAFYIHNKADAHIRPVQYKAKQNPSAKKGM